MLLSCLLSLSSPNISAAPPLTITNAIDGDAVFNITVGTPGTCTCEAPACVSGGAIGETLLKGQSKGFHAAANCDYYAVGGGIVAKDGRTCRTCAWPKVECQLARARLLTITSMIACLCRAGGFQLVRCLRRPHGWRVLKDLRRNMPRVGHHEHSRRSHRQHVRHDTLCSVHDVLQVLRAQRVPALQAGLFLPHVYAQDAPLYGGDGGHRLHHLQISRALLRIAAIEIKVPGVKGLRLVRRAASVQSGRSRLCGDGGHRLNHLQISRALLRIAAIEIKVSGDKGLRVDFKEIKWYFTAVRPRANSLPLYSKGLSLRNQPKEI